MDSHFFLVVWGKGMDCICVYVHERWTYVTGNPRVGEQNTIHQHTYVHTITHMLIELQHSVQVTLVRKEHLRVEKTFRLA